MTSINILKEEKFETNKLTLFDICAIAKIMFFSRLKL